MIASWAYWKTNYLSSILMSGNEENTYLTKAHEEGIDGFV